MQQSGGLLLAGFHPGDTIIFAIGENANESHLSHLWYVFRPWESAFKFIHHGLAKIAKTWFN